MIKFTCLLEIRQLSLTLVNNEDVNNVLVVPGFKFNLLSVSNLDPLPILTQQRVEEVVGRIVPNYESGSISSMS